MWNRVAGYCSVGALSLLAVSCYNNPDVSMRPPGSGEKEIHSGPQVGPGTVAGGSTAGPQPAVEKKESGAAEAHQGAATAADSQKNAGEKSDEHSKH